MKTKTLKTLSVSNKVEVFQTNVRYDEHAILKVVDDLQ